MPASRVGTIKSATGLVLLAIVLSIGAFLLRMQLTDNFHPVVAGEVYRSAQPSGGDIAWAHQHYGIKSILNLRGGDARSGWYRDEIQAADTLGIVHIDFPLSDSRKLTPDQMHQLIAIMRDAPKPLLIHCKAGADRSGLASALYVAAIAQQGEVAAEHQLSIGFGHVSLPISPSFAMDESWELIEPHFGYSDS